MNIEREDVCQMELTKADVDAFILAVDQQVLSYIYNFSFYHLNKIHYLYIFLLCTMVVIVLV